MVTILRSALGATLLLALTACGDTPTLNGNWSTTGKELAFTDTGSFQATQSVAFTNTISGDYHTEEEGSISFAWSKFDLNSVRRCSYSLSDDGKQLEIRGSCRLRSFSFDGIYSRK